MIFESILAVIGAITFWAVVWFFTKIAIVAGLSYLGGRLLAKDPPDSHQRTGMAGRAWSRLTTQSEDLARPRAYGQNQHGGNIITKWTDVASNREVLYVLLDHGDGPTVGIGSNNVYINDQLSSNYGSVVVQERLGTMDQTVMTGFEKTKLEYNIDNELIYNTAQTFTTPNDFFDDLEWTICWPNGLIKFHKDGKHHAVSVGLKVEISVKDAASWTTIFNTTISGETFEPKFVRYLASDYTTITKGVQYDLKFTRSTDSGERDTVNMHLKSIREVVSIAFQHPGKALVGIKAIATEQLSGRINIKTIRQDRIINVYNGSSWTLQYSTNRAWIVWDILTQPVIIGNGIGTPYSIARYDGMDTKYLDLVFFYAWAQFCETEILSGIGVETEDRCACNVIIREFTNVFTAATELATAGRANIYWKGSILTGWIDNTNTTVTDLVTMDSIVRDSWRNVWAIVPELAGVVEVLFQDAKIGYEDIRVQRGDADAGGWRNIVSVEGVGITSRGIAIHYANYLLTRNKLIRNINKFKVHTDGFRYELGDVIRLQSRPVNWGTAFKVVSATADTITVDRNAASEVSVGDVIHIRTYDTLTSQVVTDTYTVGSIGAVGVGNTITATASFDVAPVVGNLVAVGASSDIKLRRIIELEPTMDNFFEVTVETYDATLYDADDLDPSDPNAAYTWPGPTPPDTNITKKDIENYVNRTITPEADINVPIPSNLTWAGSGGDTATWSKTDGDYDITFAYAGTTNIIAADSTTDKYIYWDPASPTVFSHSDVLAVAIGGGDHWMVCINEAGVLSTVTPQQIIHGGLIQAGTITAGYAQIADATISTLKIIDHAVIDGADAYVASAQAVAGAEDVVATVAYETTGARAFVQFSCMIMATGGTGTFTFIVYRDATAIYTSAVFGAYTGVNTNVAFNISNTPAAGSYTWEVRVAASGDRTANVINRSIHVHEFKK